MMRKVRFGFDFLRTCLFLGASVLSLLFLGACEREAFVVSNPPLIKVEC